MKKVSIIIPIYNAQEKLEKCLNSILNQTYQNLEIILVNNNSTDNSTNICKKYKKLDNRIIYTEESKIGCAAARNKGIKLATGTYTTFVDADDYLEPNAIEQMVNLQNKYKTDVVRTYYNSEIPTYEKKSTNITYNKKYNKAEIINYLIEKLLLQKIESYMWLLLIKTNILKKIVIKENLIIHQDFNFFLQLLLNINSIYISKTITYNYCYNEKSSKSAPYYKRNIYNLIELNKTLKNTLLINKINNKELLTIINSRYIEMLIPYFRKIYFNDKNLFNTVYKDFKSNNEFKNITSNIKYKYLSTNIIIEYLLLFKISKFLYITYINFIEKTKIKNLLKKLFS